MDTFNFSKYLQIVPQEFTKIYSICEVFFLNFHQFQESPTLQKKKIVTFNFEFIVL